MLKLFLTCQDAFKKILMAFTYQFLKNRMPFWFCINPIYLMLRLYHLQVANSNTLFTQ